MNNNSYSCRFALTALGILFAIPALAGNPGKPIEYRDAGALPYSVVDSDRGNDLRDNRDSTLMRNDVGVLDVPGANGVDTDRANDVRDSRDSTILRSEVPDNQTTTEYGG